MPVLASVHLERDGSMIYATCCDKYTLAVQRVAAKSASGPLNATIPLATCNALLSMFRARATQDDPEIKLTFHHERLIASASRPFGNYDGAMLRFALETSEYPKVRSVLRKTFTRELALSQTPVWVDPKFLARLEIAKRHNESHVRIDCAGIGKPVAVRCGDDFLAAIQPMRKQDPPPSNDLAPGWLDMMSDAEQSA